LSSRAADRPDRADGPGAQRHRTRCDLRTRIVIGLAGTAAAAALVFSAVPGPVPGRPTPTRWPAVLHSTSRHAFVAADGTPVTLNGVNVIPVWARGSLSRRRYAAIAAKGFNSVRFVLYWDALEPHRGELDRQRLEALDTAIARASAARLYVVLDMIHLWGPRGLRSVPAWARSGDSVASVEANATAYVRMLARRYRDEPAVAAYDPVNEPHRWPIAQNAVLRMYDRLIGAIRQVAPAKIVLVEPTYGDTSIRGTCADLSNLTHRDNVVFSAHIYFAGGNDDGFGASCGQAGRYAWDGRTGYEPPDPAPLRAHLRAYLEPLAPEGIPLYVGEFGMAEGATNQARWVRDMVRLFDASGLSRAWWEPHSAAPARRRSPARARDPIVMAAGDFTSCQGAASCARSSAAKVKALMAAARPDAILGIGDFQYETIGAIENGFDLVFGPKPRGLWRKIRPTAGPTHDVRGCSDPAYSRYWGRDPMKGYSFDLRGWHIISLPSAAHRYGCDTAGVRAWLERDLEANRKRCTLAFWQDPYWTRPTAVHGRELRLAPWVRTLYQHDADLILQASNHDYQRFAPQNLRDKRDSARGLRAFVVGTGGIGHYEFTGAAPNVEASDATTYGALRLTLHPHGYDWRFEPAGGGSFSDAGSGTCH
jgi:Cellulase (glycosyl hydrolase family 5)